jgi:branched-chain amino acid aminotransferase
MSEFKSMTSVDGVITPTQEASVPVLDRGFLYGDSIYEVFRTYDGVPFLYDEHWARFENSAALSQMRLQFSQDEVGAEIKRTVHASGAQAAPCDVYVRYVVTRGEGPLGLLPDAAASQRLIVIVMAVPEWNPKHYSNGLQLAIVSTLRNSANALDPNIKGGNYMNNVLGVIEARQQGADDCVMLDAAGLITEASNSNVFFVRDGRVLTPSQKAANLKGLTKQVVMKICGGEGLDCAEAEIDVDLAAGSDECFITSATREVMPVRGLALGDGRSREFAAGGGPVTRRLMERYRGYVREYVENHARYSMY